MKLCNIYVDGETHLALVTSRGIVDLQAAGYNGSMMELISGGQVRALDKYAQDESLPVVDRPVYANVVEPIGKLLCVGLNYRSHAAGINTVSYTHLDVYKRQPESPRRGEGHTPLLAGHGGGRLPGCLLYTSRCV